MGEEKPEEDWEILNPVSSCALWGGQSLQLLVCGRLANSYAPKILVINTNQRGDSHASDCREGERRAPQQCLAPTLGLH